MATGLFHLKASNNGRTSIPEQLASEELQDESIDFTHYLRLVRRRWKVALLVVILIFGLAAARTLRQRKIYQAETKLVVVTKSPSLDGGTDSILGSLNALKQGRNVDTQVELIDSPDLLGKAFVRKLDPKYTEGRADDWNAETIRQGFGSREPAAWTSDIKSRPDTDVIMITAHAYTPAAAAHYANAIANEYEDEDLDRNQRATVKAAGWVERQRDIVNRELLDASEKLARFQRRHHLVSPPDQASNLVSNDVDIQTQYSAASGDLTGAKNRVDLLRSQIPGIPTDIEASKTLAENPEFGQVQTQIVQLEGQITEQSHEFKPTAPEIQQLRHQLSEEQDHLRSLSRTLIASSSTEANPVRLKLLGDYADAESNLVVARDHANALKSELDVLNSEIDALPDREKEFSRLDLQVELKRNNYSLLSERFATLQIQKQSTLSNVIVAAFARPPQNPASPKIALGLAVAFVVAIVSSIMVLLALDRFDNRLRQPEDAELVTGLTALSFIPEATSQTGRLVLNEAQPGHAFLESFRLLRNNLEFATLDHPCRILAVTSASMSDGKSTTSMNTALAFAKDGKRVLIIDVDLRRPTIHTWVKSSNKVGFTSAVRGLTPLDEAIQSTEWENLWALTSGPLPPDPTEFLNSGKSRNLIEQAADRFDLVVLDAPPCAGLSDMQVISKIVDGVMVVATLDVTEKPMLQSTMRLLRQAGAPLVGVVVNRMKRSNGGSYGNKGYYGYDNYDPGGSKEQRRSKTKVS